ncbi:MAG TPA: Gfo/Idh/MocA family oxidoreductase [Ardenticatenaceae bacterium]|nr:Gfo/Idh/MocA family oxidoreductase [Ardenticatenaceae bacterium]
MPASETIGFAILGTGMAADYHRQAIAANTALGARLVAVGHYDPARFAEIGARFGVPCLTEEQVVAHPGVQVVCICTPSGQHAAQAIAAARAGKHVLVEKPMALSLADTDAMIATCDAAGTALGVVLQRRAMPLFERIRRAILAGELGELTLGVVTVPYSRPQAYYDQADWRGTWALDGGGVLMNQGIHLVDLLVWYMGDPVAVAAYAGTLRRKIEVEDTLAATLRFPGGALATITATTAIEPGFPHRLEVYGTRGGIQVEGESVVRWEATGSATESARAGNLASAGAGGDPRGIAPEGHVAIVRDFIEAVRTGRPPKVAGAEGRRSLAAVLAIYQAAGLLSRQPGSHE